MSTKVLTSDTTNITCMECEKKFPNYRTWEGVKNTLIFMDCSVVSGNKTLWKLVCNNLKYARKKGKKSKNILLIVVNKWQRWIWQYRPSLSKSDNDESCYTYDKYNTHKHAPTVFRRSTSLYIIQQCNLTLDFLYVSQLTRLIFCPRVGSAEREHQHSQGRILMGLYNTR